MVRDYPLLLILDEPTAGLDVATEHALLERFAGESRRAAHRTGAITLLVSHRFSTVRMADLIVVVGAGRGPGGGLPRRAHGPRRALLRALQLQARDYC